MVSVTGLAAAWNTPETDAPLTPSLPKFFHALYRTAQLFALNGDWTVKATGENTSFWWQFLPAQTARFGAPLVIFVAGIRIFFGQFRTFWRTLWRPRQNHTILCGIGDPAHEYFRLNHHRPKSRLLLIAKPSDALATAQYQDAGVCVILGEITEWAVLEKAHANKASRIVLLLASDTENVTAAAAIAAFMANREQRPVNVWLHVGDSALSDRLEFFSRFRDDSKVEYHFFNIYELAARNLLLRYPPDHYADLQNEDRVHLVLYGFGRLGEEIAAEAARLCHYRNSSRLKITVFDRDAMALEKAFDALYPEIGKVIDIDFQSLDFRAYSLARSQLSRLPETATQHIITFADEEGAVAFAFSLRNTLLSVRNRSAAIFLRIRRRDGLGRLFVDDEGPDASLQPHGIYPFGDLESILDFDGYYSQRDQLAELLHESWYLPVRRKKKRTPFWGAKNTLHWRDLTHYLRESNRAAVDAIDTKLAAVRLRRTTLSDQSEVKPTIDIPEADSLVMAKIEKMRWNAERWVGGWRYGPRAELAKQNPFLLPWDDIERDPDLKEALDYDVSQAKDLPAVINGDVIRRLDNPNLMASDRTIVENLRTARTTIQEVRPVYVIGITGHRDIGTDPKILTTIESELRRALLEIKRSLAEPHSYVIVSPLADGIDRIGARVAIDVLDASLAVPLPLPFELYAKEFGQGDSDKHTASLKEFRDLFALAERHFELPNRFGSLADLEAGIGTPAAQDQQYALLGSYLATHCDELIAVWDGHVPTSDHEKSETFGGTWQVVGWWREPTSIPPAYQWKTTFYRAPRHEPVREIFISKRGN